MATTEITLLLTYAQAEAVFKTLKEFGSERASVSVQTSAPAKSEPTPEQEPAPEAKPKTFASTNAEPKARKPKPEPEPEPEPKSEKITLSDIRAALSKKIAGNKTLRDSAKAKLTELGAANIAKLDESKYGEFYGFVESL